MKLWLVITYLNQVIASVGPLPYDISECERRAAEIRHDGSLDVKEGAEIDGRKVLAQDIAVSCVFRDSRPEKGAKP